MSLLTDWREFAYSHDDRTREGQEFWIGYFNQEKAVYEQILATPEEPVSGTVTELAQKYNMELTYFVGFLDGINDSLKNPNPIEEMEADTVVSLDYDKEKLYYNMVAAKADWLYGLEQWDALLTPERRKELYMSREALQQQLSHLRLDVMIHVHAEVVRSTKSVVAEINNHE